MNECGNNGNDGKRADNFCDVVYLFSPLSEINSFCQYGVVLLEVDVPDDMVKENELDVRDVNHGKYVEYIIDRVQSDYIKKIYIPQLFKERVDYCGEISLDTLSKVYWCDFSAKIYGKDGKIVCPDYMLQHFSRTAEIMNSNSFNFFRGKRNNKVIDLYDVKYVF